MKGKNISLYLSEKRLNIVGADPGEYIRNLIDNSTQEDKTIENTKEEGNTQKLLEDIKAGVEALLSTQQG